MSTSSSLRPSDPKPTPQNATTDRDKDFICYGDRLAFLCDGQLLTLTHKFNLTYQQMAIVTAATMVTGGLLGVAGFLIWRKGLFRKRYAALFGAEIYTENTDGMHRNLVEGTTDFVARDRRQDRQHKAVALCRRTKRTSRAVIDPMARSKVPYGSVTFRLFEFDPKKQQLVLSSVGMPVKFGTPVVVVHPETGRAIRYLTHRGAVTLSKPPGNLAFPRQVRASLFAMDAAAMRQNASKRTRPPSRTTALVSSSDPCSNTRNRDDEEREKNNLNDHMLVQDVAHSDVMVEIADSSPNQGQPPRQVQGLTNYPRGRKLQTLSNVLLRRTQQQSGNLRQYSAQRRSFDTINSASTAFRAALDEPSSLQLAHSSKDDLTGTTLVDSTDARHTLSHCGGPVVSTSSGPAMPGLGSNAFCRSISESYMNIVSDVTDTLQQQRDRQRDRQELRRRQKALMKDLPNMSFNNHLGKYYVATIEPVRHRTTGSNNRLPVAPTDEYLRWGQPMSLISKFNGRACGIRPREYYKDSNLYLTTEASSTTIVPLREDGDLKCMAKESTRYLAHLEKRRVKVSVGTYNVWMLPRKVSAFTSCSPKKNTRARMIGDVLPSCDIWVLTECFDYRARNILLDKMAEAGYFFFSPTVGHKRMNKSNMRKLLNGGVLLVSKYPILSVRVKLFEGVCAGGDKLADKGVLYCKILKDGLLVHIFSTHLQAWNDPISRMMRKMQMDLIAKFMSAMDIDKTNDVVLFVGDMNVDYWLNKTNREYDEMLEIFDAKDPSVVHTRCPRKLGNASDSNKELVAEFKHLRKHSFDPRVNALAADGLSTDGSLELLDYVLYSRTHRQPKTASSWVLPLTTMSPWKWRGQLQYNLSDHFPVVSEFTFNM